MAPPLGPGTLYLVVGPSGVGKDTLIDGARAELEATGAFVFAQRTVTRPREAGGEAHEPLSVNAFEAERRTGAFAVTWQAHGLAYGVRNTALTPLAEGRNVVLNASRTTIDAFARLAARTLVIAVTAPSDVVRRRLEARGREDAADVAARLGRAVALPAGIPTVTLDNSGPVHEAVAKMRAALVGAAHLALRVRASSLEAPGLALALVHRDSLPIVSGQLPPDTAATIAGHPGRLRLLLTDRCDLAAPDEVALHPLTIARAGLRPGERVVLQRARPAASRDVLRRKIAGATLSDDEMHQVVRDIAEERYEPTEVAGFLVAAAQSLTTAEVAALTLARASLATRIAWDAPFVADKHSVGGVPASPISLIVVPIVAAHGLPIPKTSSRAITSAAGTADVMACVARVDLDAAALRATVAAAGGALAWSGRIVHSPLDDVMNAINRPLGIRSAFLDTASILSKKLAVGSTHALIDIPVGPGAKLATPAAGKVLAQLFETVGRAVGLTVATRVSDARAPVGRGVGPALELADAWAVLAGDPAAPPRLREKALAFAATILEWDPAVPEGAGRPRAEALLASGAAREHFERIVEAQGRCPVVAPGAFTRTITAPRAGRISAIDPFAVAGLARALGAPGDRGAGLALHGEIGAAVEAETPLATLHARTQDALEAPVDETLFAIA